jgi:hypothetical protein
VIAMHENMQQVNRLLIYQYRIPSYRMVCRYLNKNGSTSSIGNSWTERSLYRMLQRNGYSGLWGLNRISD